MLSTLALKRAGPKALNSVRLVSITPQRHSAVPAVSSTYEPAVYESRYKEDYPSSSNIPLTVEERVQYWKKANDTFFGPDRDLKNFPHPEYKKVVTEEYNFGFIPTRWFKCLYPQLGVSGCYTLVWGLALFAVSKEYYVIDHGTTEIVAAVLALNWARLKWGAKIEAWLDKKREIYRQELYDTPLEEATKGYKAEVVEIEQDIARQDAVPVIFQAKQEQIDLQLETEYRQRLAEVYETVRRRLEYQADLEHTQRAFEQNHMVNWIVSSVQKSITPQQEKENLASCIRTLKNLSASASL